MMPLLEIVMHLLLPSSSQSSRRHLSPPPPPLRPLKLPPVVKIRSLPPLLLPVSILALLMAFLCLPRTKQLLPVERWRPPETERTCKIPWCEREGLQMGSSWGIGEGGIGRDEPLSKKKCNVLPDFRRRGRHTEKCWPVRECVVFPGVALNHFARSLRWTPRKYRLTMKRASSVLD